MKIFIYKRTHTGDPDESGQFGINDCMGTLRNLPFDAVIGVGGTGQEAQSYGIDRKVNWIGVHPTRHPASDFERAGIVTFEKFALFDEDGDWLHVVAPNLAKRMYAGCRFIFTSISPSEQAEAMELLKLADVISEPRPAAPTGKIHSICKPMHCAPKRPAKSCG